MKIFMIRRLTACLVFAMATRQFVPDKRFTIDTPIDVDSNKQLKGILT